MPINAAVSLVGTSVHRFAWLQKDTSTFRTHGGPPNLLQRGGLGKHRYVVPTGAGTQVLSLTPRVLCNSLIYPHPPSLPRSSLSVAGASAGCGRREVRSLDEVLSSYFAQRIIFILFVSTSRFLCRQFNSPWLLAVKRCLPCHHDGTHTHHMSSTSYIRGSFPVIGRCLFIKRVKRRLGRAEKRLLRPASRHYAWMDMTRVQREKAWRCCVSIRDTFVPLPIPGHYGMTTSGGG